MKKIVFLVMALMMLTGSCMAAQRYIAVYKNRANDVAEVNYYLERGGKVVMMTSTSDMKAAHCYVVVEYPDSVPVFKNTDDKRTTF